MLSNNRNVVKYCQVDLSDKGTRVIDYNERIAEKIEQLSRDLEESLKDDETMETFPDEFTDGIEAASVSRLLDDDAEGAVYGGESANEQYNGPAAEEIIEEAHNQAGDILVNANREAEEIKSRAREEGYREGYNEGKSAAEAELMAVRDQTLRELSEKEEAQTKYYQDKIKEIEPALVDKITKIYEQIFRIRLDDQKDIVFHLLANALRDMDGGHEYLVHVSPEDIAFVSTRKDQLIEACGIVNASFEVFEDATLSKNECIIETENGIFDCSLGVELAELKKELMLLAYEGID